MSIYDLAMQDPQFRRIILVEFGFGDHPVIKVEKWLKKNYPYKVAEWKKQVAKGNVTQLHREGMAREERDRLLDKAMSLNEIFRD
ncbi:hypothetical protein ACTXGU_00065 [Niallia sp. 01092]|uniref:hypothetical protein n=1 Tax=Niallia sp. 01092 TaxID=3457759 RepID=UPI003FD2FBEC